MKTYKNCTVCNSAVSVVNEKYNLGQCQKCNLIFCLDSFTQEEFVRVYDELYNDLNAVYKNHSVTEFNRLGKNNKIRIGLNRSALIKKYILKSNSHYVLEIGSGIGLIGSYIRQKNDGIKYLGIELDEEAFKKSQLLGLNTINGDFKEIQNLEHNFDVIMLWEVIEHLQDLDLFLKLACNKLNEGGKIILSTPNYNKIYNYPDRQKDQLFQSLPPVHLNFFSRDNIKNIFEKHNFKNWNAVLKKWPYLELGNFDFYRNVVKTVMNKYQGSTIYFVGFKTIVFE